MSLMIAGEADYLIHVQTLMLHPTFYYQRETTPCVSGTPTLDAAHSGYVTSGPCIGQVNFFLPGRRIGGQT